MFIPLHDANSLQHIKLQYVTLGLIACNVLVYLLANVTLSESAFNAAAVSFGYIPAVVNDFRDLPPELAVIPENLSLVSYSFLHGDFMHLAGNMLFLWVFGDNVEDALGHIKFLIFYLACAAAGALAHGLLDLQSEAPLIGASGAVAGIIGAYLLLHPKVWVWVLVMGRIPIRLPAAVLLVFWIGLQFYMVFAMPEDTVSWAAHIGGFVAGAILVLFLRRRDVPLFDRTIVRPLAVETTHSENASTSSSEAPGPWGRG